MTEKDRVLLECAHSIIEVTPRLSRLMRKDLRIHSAGLFTEPQFRVMARLYREGGQCLSGLAESQGVSLPTMSKLIQGIESRDLVARTRDTEDRRRVLLVLTETGRAEYEGILRHTEAHIVHWIKSMEMEQCKEVIRAFNLLDSLFSQVDLDAFYEDLKETEA